MLSWLHQPHCEHQTAQTIEQVAEGGAEAINERLECLDREWSSGRAGKATAAAMIAAGLGLAGSEKPRRALALLGGGLLAHALWTRRGLLDGLFERMGFRCHSEIERERVALRTLRGGFHGLPTLQHIENREDISRFEGEGGTTLDADEAKYDHQEAARDLLHAAQP